MDYSKITSADLKNRITDTVQRFFGVKPEEASNTQMYKAVCIVVRDMLTNSRVDFKRTRAKSTQNMFTICRWSSFSDAL